MMEYLRFGLALVFVLGLIGACSWFGKRMGLAPRVSRTGGAQRISVTEIRAIDAKRKLVLIRRDAVEHLVLLNGDRDLLIESGIAPSGGGKDHTAPDQPASPMRVLPFWRNARP